MKLTDRELKILKTAVERRVMELRRAADGCAGDLYPGIYDKEADDLQALFRRIVFGPKKPAKKGAKP